MVVVLLVVIGAGAWYVMGVRASNTGPPSAGDLAKSRYDLPQMTTNLAGGSVVQLQVALQADSPKTKEELDLRKVQVQDAVIGILHNWKREDLDKPQGLEKLKGEIMKKVNELLRDGRVQQVYLASIIVQ